ncbi:septal ring lytic transglycosylase RlpA family protein [Halioxenophilus sp. WMMB6]|uniref:septal ring lytic transglycosylase RlpA family protein n=1 Tax=Halioxenophilus sp. WMMB6 TaxID=3073815 RepID=UPI00295F2AAA|nr:septal ring lytic transglycosylase RlpA family protein [Halioxenophilus sp. WMMB6]
MQIAIRIGLVAAVVTLVGCVNVGGGSSGDFSDRYSQKHDSYPSEPKSVDHIPDAVPIPEPRTVAGNRSPYNVNGQTYRVLASEVGYSERGIASWYGEKFHGHATSNGEIYDMYGMTAAHKTLPIPSYVRVTNLDNQKSVIVRVNDRGPFHSDRLIDLTYAAAKKLGYVQTGTARVQVTAIDPVAWQREHAGRLASVEVTTRAPSNSGEAPAPAPLYSGGYSLPANTFLQAGAFSSAQAAQDLRNRIAKIINFPVQVNPPSGETPLYRVRIGPIADNLQASSIRALLIQQNFSAPHLVYE